MFFTLDKDESNWEVMSSSSSKSERGFSRVMRRLLKKSNQLSMVTNERNVFPYVGSNLLIKY